MKFLVCPEIEPLNALLADVDLGDSELSCRLEAYSCKRAGDDKKLAKQLEEQYVEAIATSPQIASSLSRSPMGDLSDHSIRKVFINLISTLNASYPDYDFSSVGPDQFVKEPDFQFVASCIQNALQSANSATINQEFFGKFWAVIDGVIDSRDCDIYSYTTDNESDPFSEDGAIWSFNYFFHSKKLKKILFLTCVSKNKNSEIMDREEMGDDDNDGQFDMEMEDPVF